MYGKFRVFSKYTSDQSGFTLLELLVVFSLTVIITGVGFVSFAQYSLRQQLDQTAQDIKFAFDNARFNAVSSVKPTECVTANIPIIGYRVDLEEDSYAVTPLCGDSTTPTVISSEKKKLPSGIVLEDTDDCDGIVFSTLYNSVTKSGSGGVDCEMTLKQESGPGSKILQVQPNGTVSIK